MKSLVEEASSITKAIEKAWIRAGQPQSFSVKIFETPEIGFLGFTKKSAKVGIFFEEPTPERTGQKKYSRPANKRTNRRPSEHGSRPNAPHREPKEDSSEYEQKRTHRREDNRAPRTATPRHREDNRESRPAERPRNDRPQNDRPQQSSSRDSDRPQSRPQQQQRHSRPERPVQARPTEDRPPVNKPAQEPTTPVAKPQVNIAPQAPVAKRPLKISGRRFSGHKKDKPENS